MIKWETTKEEAERIARIADRAWELLGEENPYEDIQSLKMDLTATHLNGCPLDLEKLENFDDFNLLHDICGIYRELDRTTAKLGIHFLPRCYLQPTAA